MSFGVNHYNHTNLYSVNKIPTVSKYERSKVNGLMVNVLTYTYRYVNYFDDVWQLWGFHAICRDRNLCNQVAIVGVERGGSRQVGK
jgi:hypothetical protein